MSAKGRNPLHWQAIALPFEPDTWARPIGRPALQTSEGAQFRCPSGERCLDARGRSSSWPSRAHESVAEGPRRIQLGHPTGAPMDGPLRLSGDRLSLRTKSFLVPSEGGGGKKKRPSKNGAFISVIVIDILILLYA